MQFPVCSSAHSSCFGPQIFCSVRLRGRQVPRALGHSVSTRTLVGVNHSRKHSSPFSLYARGVRAAAPSTSMEDEQWLTFPFLSASGKRLMEECADIIAKELGSSLELTRTPADVRHFKNPQGNGEGSVTLRSGKQGSPIDFVLGSWLHCALPFGVLNIATLVGMNSLETDAPHLLFEFIQPGPNSLVVVLDLLPRKNLVFDGEYLKRFYEDTALESIRQELQKTPGAQRYDPPTLYIRCLTSPTCIMYKVEGSSEQGQNSLDQIIENSVSPAAKGVINVWLESVFKLGKKVHDADAEILLGLDTVIKTKGVEVDLSSNMPRLFGQEIADRVVQAFRRGE
ncbi:hypothetical protein KP509_37G055000 [Ceratopteris richardii]|uniref:Red chlorophyll catabolite reductase n=1 Tax=Ceratopteris richardii TaxID=49495 RepID=A0A8T2QAB5_CERRI|nr:hypothetical protein KP509_37G055000 [Ceratopteris richardii]